jgi:hypothetical protein
MSVECWFCKKAVGHAGSSVEQTVIRPRSLTHELKEAHVSIPRCQSCQALHAIAPPGANAVMSALTGGVLGAGAILGLRAIEWSVVMAEAPGTTLAAGATLGMALGAACQALAAYYARQRQCARAGVKSLEDIADHHEVAAILAEVPT